MPTRQATRYVLTLAFGVAALYGAQASASFWYEKNPAIKPGIPDFCWEEPKDADIMCPHVALANALWYWDKKMCPDLVPTELEALKEGTMENWNKGGKFPADLYKELAKPRYLGPGGAKCADMRPAIENWFSDHGGGLRLEVQNFFEDGTKPTWEFYKEQLKKCEIPLVKFQDGADHWVVGAGWRDDQFAFHDPRYSYAGGEEFYDWEIETTGSYKDFMKFDYGTYGDCYIVCVFAVSQIPEPSAFIIWSLLGALGITVGWWRRPRRGG